MALAACGIGVPASVSSMIAATGPNAVSVLMYRNGPIFLGK
jgi:hypothetical protein